MRSEDGLLVVLVTAPVEAAPTLASELVRRRVAACANVVAGIESHFWWEGEVQSEPEALLILKTQRSRYDALEAAVVELHPYDVPEVVALEAARALPAYAAWATGALADAP